MLHTGDLRPRSWFWTFSNVRPRPAARGFPAGVLAGLRERSPALRFTAPTQRSGDDPRAPPPSPAIPEGLTGQFEVFVGLAQHRFFDRSCAVAMARTLYDLLVAFIDTPALHPCACRKCRPACSGPVAALVTDLGPFGRVARTHRYP
jgi:hypothetical protein